VLLAHVSDLWRLGLVEGRVVVHEGGQLDLADVLLFVAAE
jgi:hypothetical protein